MHLSGYCSYRYERKQITPSVVFGESRCRQHRCALEGTGFEGLERLVGLCKGKVHGVGFDGNGGSLAQEIETILPGIGCDTAYDAFPEDVLIVVGWPLAHLRFSLQLTPGDSLICL